MYIINKTTQNWDILLSVNFKMWKLRFFTYRNYPYKIMLNIIFLGIQFRIIKYKNQ